MAFLNARFESTVAILVVAMAAAAISGCKRNEDPKKTTKVVAPSPTGAPGVVAQSDEELAVVLASIDDVTISVGEFQERINRQSPYIRARYTSVEQKKEFLDNLIRFEVLAKEAARRKFNEHPDVVRTMKQVMIQKLMKDEFEDKIKPEDIPDAELQAFYKEHEKEYNTPEQVRVSAIVLKKKSDAAKVAKDATGKPGSSNKGFRELVNQHSIDSKTKIRGGDLRYFDVNSTEVPRPVIEAAFKLTKTGDVAGPIDAGDGQFYIIKQTGKRKAVSKPFEEVKRQIQNRVFRDKRSQAQKDFLANLKNSAKIVIHEDKLAKVRVDTSTAGAPGHGHGQEPGSANAFPPPGPAKVPGQP